MIKELVEAIASGNNIAAEELVSKILEQKIRTKIKEIRESVTPTFERHDLLESLRSRLVVRNGKIRRRWSYVGSDNFSVRGKTYAAKVARVTSNGRRESRRSAAQVREKVIKMKRLWKSSLRAKLPQMLRNRLRSMKIAKHLEVY